MKKRISWKRVCAGLVIAAALVQLWLEFDVIVLFFAVPFGVGVAWLLVRTRWEAGREQKNREEQEAREERVHQEEVERRREACREARYCREEQERLEAHIETVLGPVREWDLDRDADALCLDAALIPPTETLPCWKAATMGAGACVMEAGGDRIDRVRVELVMALPPDWDPADRWPVQVLRDAARRFLIVDGFAGYHSVYRGFSILGTGFAGAVAEDEFPGLPALGAAAMPGAPPVRFWWLIPLLKPELDYFQHRGMKGLERRFASSHPWADPHRASCVNPLTWFQEDIAPFTWSEDEGLYCLGLEFGTWHQELFERMDRIDLTWAWEKLAKGYLRRHQPDDLPFVEFACEEGTFFAASHDEEIMRHLALGLSDLLRDRPEEAQCLLY